MAVVTNAVNDKFLTMSTINSILGQAAGLGVVSAGATILVISGHFDISTGRMVGLAMCAMALMLNAGMNPVLVSICGILICVACSVFNGAASILFNAPSFVVTLATQNIYYSIALLLTNGYMQTLYGKYRTLASYEIFGVFPLIYLVLLLGFVAVYLILKHTRTGREVYAIGTNQRLSLIHIFRRSLCGPLLAVRPFLPHGLDIGPGPQHALRSAVHTVSYTHLDVYKRQAHTCGEIK